MKITFSDIVRLPLLVIWFSFVILGNFMLGMLEAPENKKVSR